MRVKKYCILFVATAGILTAIFWYGSTCKGPQQVETVTIQAQNIRSTVLCSGKVEDAQSYNVDSQIPVIADSILVKEGDIVKKGDILMTVDQEATVRALMDKYLGSGSQTQLVQAMAGVMDATQLMDYLKNPEQALSAELSLPQEITAPASGVVRQVQAETQTLSGGGSPLFVVASDDHLRVCLSISENAISDIKTGQVATVTGTGFKNSVYTGRVIKIADSATQRLNGVTYETVVEVMLSIDKPGSDLKPGLSASATITTGEQKNVIIIPYEAIRTDDDGTEFVFRCINNSAVKTPVVLGEECENGYAVSAGISDGDVIVTAPELVEDGMSILAVPAKMEEEVQSDAE